MGLGNTFNNVKKGITDNAQNQRDDNDSIISGVKNVASDINSNIRDTSRDQASQQNSVENAASSFIQRNQKPKGTLFQELESRKYAAPNTEDMLKRAEKQTEKKRRIINIPEDSPFSFINQTAPGFSPLLGDLDTVNSIIDAAPSLFDDNPDTKFIPEFANAYEQSQKDRRNNALMREFEKYEDMGYHLTNPIEKDEEGNRNFESVWENPSAYTWELDPEKRAEINEGLLHGWLDDKGFYHGYFNTEQTNVPERDSGNSGFKSATEDPSRRRGFKSATGDILTPRSNEHGLTQNQKSPFDETGVSRMTTWTPFLSYNNAHDLGGYLEREKGPDTRRNDLGIESINGIDYDDPQFGGWALKNEYDWLWNDPENVEMLEALGLERNGNYWNLYDPNHEGWTPQQEEMWKNLVYQMYENSNNDFGFYSFLNDYDGTRDERYRRFLEEYLPSRINANRSGLNHRLWKGDPNSVYAHGDLSLLYALANDRTLGTTPYSAMEYPDEFEYAHPIYDPVSKRWNNEILFQMADPTQGDVSTYDNALAMQQIAANPEWYTNEGINSVYKDVTGNQYDLDDYVLPGYTYAPDFLRFDPDKYQWDRTYGMNAADAYKYREDMDDITEQFLGSIMQERDPGVHKNPATGKRG